MKCLTKKDQKVISLKIENNSSIQKYKQIVNSIISDIENSILKRNDQLPSINELSEEYYLSRDTVEKAYNELRARGAIISVPGKGYFVSTIKLLDKVNVFLLFNKLSDQKRIIYNSFVKSLGKKGKVDLFVYHNDGQIFQNLISENIGNYNYYVVIPHIDNHASSELEILNKIPKNKLIVLDKDVKNIYQGEYGGVYQNFEKDIYNALHSLSDLLKKYEELILVFNEDSLHPKEIKSGFIKFCQETSSDYRILDRSFDFKTAKKTAFITLEEKDLVQLLRIVKMNDLKLGEDIGIISYNDDPLKELLEEGITVISTDFEKMGEAAGSIIFNKKKEKIENPFHVFRRNSL